MLDIFGSDKRKKKEELRENMDKIRDMVDSRLERPGQQDGAQPAPGQQGDSSQQEEPARPSPPPSRDAGGSSSRSRPQPEEDSRDDRSQETQHDRRQDLPQSRREVKRQEPQHSTEEQDPRQEDRSTPEVPDAPETRDIDVPEVQKGPLFIRVKKFKEAKSLISQMEEMNQKVETQLGGMRNTLDEDSRTTNRLQEALQTLDDSMKSIKKIVSP